MIKKVFLLFLFFQLGFAQKVTNDSLISKFEKDFVYRAIEISKLSNLRNDTISNFYFRLNHADLIVDLYRDVYGKLNLKSTQFVIQNKKNIIKDTIVFYKFHDSNTANWLYTKIVDSKLEEKVPFKNKTNGKSGVLMNDDYYIEFSNKKKYQIKSFPFSELDTISKNYSLKNVIDELFEKIEVEKEKKDFFESLPNGFHYSKMNRAAFYKLHNSSISLDYLGDYRLPFGFSSYYYVNKIAKKRFNLGALINCQVGFNGNSSVKTYVNKYNIFSDNKSFSDLIRFSYEIQDLDYIKSVGQFENYKINYAFSIDKYFNFGISYNQLVINSRYNGLDLAFSKKIESIELTPYYEISLYENHLTNYVVGVSKTIKFNIHEKPIRIYSNLYYEKLFDFRNVNFSLQIPLLYFGLN
jgi:hypothetical protein